jgi:transcriptional regulator with XRE-family HTH domain
MKDLRDLHTQNLNIRCLVWSKAPEPGRWAGVLRRKAGIPEKRAREILNGAEPSAEERAAIVEGFEVEEDTLGSARLLGMSEEEVLAENVKYLIRSLPKGEQRKMAAALGTAQESVSRWKKGGKPPKQKNVEQISRYLRLSLDLDLRVTPLFLSLQPVGHFAQRAWLQKKLEELPAEDLSKLFPALEKLLSGHEED